MRTDYVQYGCGWSAPTEWMNFDASPTLRFERLPIIGSLYTRNSQRFPSNVLYGDISSGLPIPDNSCTAVYCSHILEHLSLQDFRTALRNTHRIIKPGGVFRLVVPDLEVNIQNYINSQSPTASIEFLSDTLLGRERRQKGLKALLLSVLGNNEHLWMWDYKALAHELAAAGFNHIRRAQYGDADDRMFGLVEEASRWDNCLGVECQK